MRQRRKGLGGGSVFRTPYVPIPINKTASLGAVKLIRQTSHRSVENCHVKNHLYEVDTRKKLSTLRNIVNTDADNGSDVDNSAVMGLLEELPRIKYFRVLRAVDTTCVKYILIIKVCGMEDLDTPSHFIEARWAIKCRDTFSSEEEARRIGYAIKSCWGRKNPSKKHEEDWHILCATVNDYLLGQSCTEGVSSCEYEPNKLPQIAYFKVFHSISLSGFYNFNPWFLLVSCKDGKGLRMVSDIGRSHGMEIQSAFKTREEAICAGKNFQNAWGVV